MQEGVLDEFVIRSYFDRLRFGAHMELVVDVGDVFADGVTA